jgi:pimeloyl-ACP methyl ester carboxylesterase
MRKVFTLVVTVMPLPFLAGAEQSLLRILGIVTAFTIGHSITLTLAAMKAVQAPERSVEVLIAATILVSAVHALRPIFPGREAWIAGFFGLIHGLAFAATLARLGLSHWQRVAGILAFNLGIETMPDPCLLHVSDRRIGICRSIVGWVNHRAALQSTNARRHNRQRRRAACAVACCLALSCESWLQVPGSGYGVPPLSQRNNLVKIGSHPSS